MAATPVVIKISNSEQITRIDEFPLNHATTLEPDGTPTSTPRVGIIDSCVEIFSSEEFSPADRREAAELLRQIVAKEESTPTGTLSEEQYREYMGRLANPKAKLIPFPELEPYIDKLIDRLNVWQDLFNNDTHQAELLIRALGNIDCSSTNSSSSAELETKVQNAIVEQITADPSGRLAAVAAEALGAVDRRRVFDTCVSVLNDPKSRNNHDLRAILIANLSKFDRSGTQEHEKIALSKLVKAYSDSIAPNEGEINTDSRIFTQRDCMQILYGLHGNGCEHPLFVSNLSSLIGNTMAEPGLRCLAASVLPERSGRSNLECSGALSNTSAEYDKVNEEKRAQLEPTLINLLRVVRGSEEAAIHKSIFSLANFDTQTPSQVEQIAYNDAALAFSEHSDRASVRAWEGHLITPTITILRNSDMFPELAGVALDYVLNTSRQIYNEHFEDVVSNLAYHANDPFLRDLASRVYLQKFLGEVEQMSIAGEEEHNRSARQELLRIATSKCPTSIDDKQGRGLFDDIRAVAAKEIWTRAQRGEAGSIDDFLTLLDSDRMFAARRATKGEYAAGTDFRAKIIEATLLNDSDFTPAAAELLGPPQSRVEFRHYQDALVPRKDENTLLAHQRTTILSALAKSDMREAIDTIIGIVKNDPNVSVKAFAISLLPEAYASFAPNDTSRGDMLWDIRILLKNIDLNRTIFSKEPSLQEVASEALSDRRLQFGYRSRTEQAAWRRSLEQRLDELSRSITQISTEEAPRRLSPEEIRATAEEDVRQIKESLGIVDEEEEETVTTS